MEPTKEIETVAINSKKYVTFIWPFLFGGTALAMFVAVKTHSSAFTYTLMAFFWGGPLLLGRTIRSFYTKKAVLQFYTDKFIIQLINEDTDALESTSEYAFADIVNYRSSSSARNNSFYFSMLLKDGQKVKYSFWPPEYEDYHTGTMAMLDGAMRDYNKTPGRPNTIAYRYIWSDYKSGRSPIS